MARDEGQAILVISGPSGVGKTSVARALTGDDGRLVLAVTSTTRAARPGELDGRDYHFLSEDEFDRLLEDDGFIEYVSARGARYGLTRAELGRIWEDGHVPVLVLDPAGKDAVKALYPQALSVFIDAPSAVVTERLFARGDTDVAARMSDNLKVWAARDGYDAVVSNEGDIETCVDGVHRVFDSRSRTDDATQMAGDIAHETKCNDERRDDMAELPHTYEAYEDKGGTMHLFALDGGQVRWGDTYAPASDELEDMTLTEVAGTNWWQLVTGHADPIRDEWAMEGEFPGADAGSGPDLMLAEDYQWCKEGHWKDVRLVASSEWLDRYPLGIHEKGLGVAGKEFAAEAVYRHGAALRAMERAQEPEVNVQSMARESRDAAEQLYAERGDGSPERDNGERF